MSSGEMDSDKNKESVEDSPNADETEEKPEKNDSPSAEDEQHDDDNEKSKDRASRQQTSNSENSLGSKVRAQMMVELETVKEEMIRASTMMKKPKLKPYTPDIYNSLSPYYNTYLINYVMKDQDSIYQPWGSYGQRQTALDIVVPEMSLKMDSFPLPAIASNVPGQLYKMKIWSKNLSGQDKDLGSTRLPPIPSLSYPKMSNPEYQHFKMTYEDVPKFRDDVRKMCLSLEEKRKKSDYERVQKDWRRMNFDELKELPERSRFHYSKAISTYLGTSKGSLKAVHSLRQSLNGTPEES